MLECGIGMTRKRGVVSILVSPHFLLTMFWLLGRSAHMFGIFAWSNAYDCKGFWGIESPKCGMTTNRKVQ